MKWVEVLKFKGHHITLEEESFRTKLENLQRELNQPAHFKGQLNELAALMRMQEDRLQTEQPRETLDEDSLERIHSVRIDGCCMANSSTNLLYFSSSVLPVYFDHFTNCYSF